MRYLSNKTTWTNAMKEFARSTLKEKLSNLVSDPDDAEIKVTKVDIRIKVDVNYEDYRAQAIGDDFYLVMLEVSNKLKGIIAKHKKKYTQYEQLDFEGNSLEVEEPARRKIQYLLKQTYAEAKAEMDKTDFDFYAYFDIDEGNPAIIYRRHEGNVGVIDLK